MQFRLESVCGDISVLGGFLLREGHDCRYCRLLCLALRREDGIELRAIL